MKRYRQAFPEVPDDSWLPEEFSGAFVGMGERDKELAPVYRYGQLLELIPGDAETKFDAVSKLLMAHPNVAVLYAPAKKEFWERVASREFLAWEQLTPYMLGVIAYGACRPHAAAYDRAAVLVELTNRTVDSEGADAAEIAQSDYLSQLLAVSVGERTPWYIFT